MKFLTVCAVLFLVALGTVVVSIVPDTLEASAYSWAAGKLEAVKKDAMANSVEVQALKAELAERDARIAALTDQLGQYEHATTECRGTDYFQATTLTGTSAIIALFVAGVLTVLRRMK